MGQMTITSFMTGIKNWVLGKIGAITDLIPTEASSSNKLADKAFVNSSIATATATFRGTYNVVSDLSLSYNATHAQIQTALGSAISTVDNNDYAFVQIPTADATPTQIAKIEKYKYNGTAWAFEYELNNSGFTAAQWAAINSGATLELIGKLSALPTNAELTTLLNGKENTSNKVTSITENSTDAQYGSAKSIWTLVQSAINTVKAWADGKFELLTNKVTSISSSSTDTQYPSAKCVYDQVKALNDIVADLETIAEGYVRVAGSSNPALNYKSYKYHEQGGFGRESVFSLFYPCLIGTKLTGNDAQVGHILHILNKLDWAHDIYGNERRIDGSEGDVLITNIEPYYYIRGRHTISSTEYDVFLVSRTPFTWQGIEAERAEKFGWSPDYCVKHTDTDSVARMHSVYNPLWDGSYQAPDSVVGKFIFSQDAETGEITEEYDSSATLLGGAGGLHSTDITLYDGEQYAMNQNPDTTKCVPFMNHTAEGCNKNFTLLLAEGGTFDAHNASLMGGGFCSNDGATAAADWEAAGSGAKNGVRVKDKNDTWKYFNLNTNAKTWLGKSGDFYLGQMVNAWRNPFGIMEAQRAVCYAIQHDVHELEWFVFEGNKYKWRSVTGFASPAQGEMTCVLWKLMATKAASNMLDPTDKTTSIQGNRVEILISIALFHGMTTQVSPSWWTSGLVFTEDASKNYEAYFEREQESLIKTENGEIATSSNFNFETLYEHVGSYATGEGYRKNYHNEALMLPDTNANKTGAGLHTYVGGYNWFTGGAAASGKKLVRGFRRGLYAHNANLSPLAMYGSYAPSYASASFAFGICVRIED